MRKEGRHTAHRNSGQGMDREGPGKLKECDPIVNELHSKNVCGNPKRDYCYTKQRTRVVTQIFGIFRPHTVLICIWFPWWLLVHTLAVVKTRGGKEGSKQGERE